jgi:hypothetical protein
VGQANDIEPSKEHYTASWTPSPITIDGSIDTEWSAIPKLADPKFAVPKGSGAGGKYVLFEEYAGGTWTGPDDQTSAVQIAYDADNVYFGFIVTDDYHENAAHSAWNGDSVQLMIASGDRTSQIGLYNYALGGTDDAGVDSTAIVQTEAGPGAGTAVITRDAANHKTYYEIQLPASSLGLGAPLTPGTKFGLGMAINDGDKDTPGQRGWGGLGAHAIVFGKSPGETAEITLGANTTTIEILGTGTASLIGGDLTDPENDGNEDAGPTDPSWNWKSIDASVEPGFGGGEFAFNVFDNKLGPSNDKWCCDDPTPDKPVWVAVEFVAPVSLTDFTVSSANDVPDRDPTNWAIQGSNDGQSYADIYHFQAPNVVGNALWTDRLQVIHFTLPNPAPFYRYIRYIAWDTPGNLHQIGEIEYFGHYGSEDSIFVSAVNPGIDSFSFRANDFGAATVDPASGKLTIDGTPVTLASTPGAGVVDYVYTPATPFLPGSSHTYTISVKDAFGNATKVDGSFKTPAYGLLAAGDKVTPDTGKPGFIWRVTQNSAFQANNNNRPLQQLAGLLGKNFADPNNYGVAVGPGTPGATENDPITFEIEGVINLDQAGGSNGHATPDGQMPGFPSTDGSAADPNGIAGEATTYIQLTAGKHTLVVNSDDGFRSTVGNIDDVFKATLAGEFSGGRGASDTAFLVYAPEDGVYGFRTVWEEGGGGANVEILEKMGDGSFVLVNDTANGGPASYRAVTGNQPTAITAVTPLVGATGVAPNTAIAATIREGDPAIDLNSVKISLGGVVQNVSATRAGNLITISFQPPTVLSGLTTYTAGITYTTSGGNPVTRSETWTFKTAAVLSGDLKVTADTGKPGFIWRVTQNSAFQANNNNRPLQQLAGLLGKNFADPNNYGVAVGPGTPGATENDPITFEIEGVINLDQAAGSNGHFRPDGQMPGFPSTDGSGGDPNGIAGEATAYIQLSAGMHTFVVNSDDGFRTTAGNIDDVLAARVLGEFSGGRGASDTAYSFFVAEDGIYPFRTVWEEGGGGANVEWFEVLPGGTLALINDTANGGPAAYRAVTSGGSAPSVISVTPASGSGKATGSTLVQAVIQEGSVGIVNGSVGLKVDGSAVAAQVSRNGNIVTASFQPPAPLAVGAHTATISFTYGAITRSGDWSFSVVPTTYDRVHSYPGLVLGNAKYSADQAGHSGQAGDYALDLGSSGNASVEVADGSFVNGATANNTLSVSLWVKKYNNADSSAFWFDSPSSNNGQRGYQAHIPWSNGHVYFDTAGCCGGDTRIEGDVAGAIPGFDWQAWHHFLFVKAGDAKQVYIDGNVFLDGTGTAPLPSDIVRLWIGQIGGGPDGGGSYMHGLIDDFVIYETGLSQSDAAALAGGASPDSIAGAIAWWAFDDAPNAKPRLTITRSGNNVTVSWTGGGTLEVADSITGPWVPVTGATSPVTAAIDRLSRFARVRVP